MFWIGIIIGLFVGANVGVVIAGLLFSAKSREDVQIRIEKTEHIEVIDRDTAKNKKKSFQTARKSVKVQKESSNRTISKSYLDKTL